MGASIKNLNPYFGTRLKQLRKERGLTQAELGKIVNKGDSTVRMWELRSSEPDYETILLLADYFGVSVDYLLGKEEIEEINQELCNLIREAQGDRGQNQFAQQCDISSSAITRIMTGSYTPSAKVLAKIASKAANGVTYEMLMNAAGYLTAEQQSKNKDNASSKSKGKWINVYGRIAAGIPIEAIEDIIDQEEISAEMAAHGEYIALKVKGSSMAPRIMDGDVVIIRLQEQVNNNEIAAVFVNGDECTLKKIKKEDNGLWLEPLNTAYTPLFYSKKQCAELPVRILGKMVELRAKF